MTIYLFHISKIISKGQEGNSSYFSTELEHNGQLKTIIVYFRNKTFDELLINLGHIAISGEIASEKEKIVIKNAAFCPFPSLDNWETYITNILSTVNATIKIHETKSSTFLFAWKNKIYISLELDRLKQKIRQLKFGCFIQTDDCLMNNEIASWNIGVFSNNKNTPLQFIQSSYYNDNITLISLEYTETNKLAISDVLKIPIEVGWKEENFKIGEDGFYKARVTVNDINQNWTYALKSFYEQDIPLITDYFEQWIRVIWGDCFINNDKRKIEINIVKPMMEK